MAAGCADRIICAYNIEVEKSEIKIQSTRNNFCNFRALFTCWPACETWDKWGVLKRVGGECRGEGALAMEGD